LTLENANAIIKSINNCVFWIGTSNNKYLVWDNYNITVLLFQYRLEVLLM